MILTIIVEKTDDGFEADIASIKGCDAWAPSEEEALEKVTSSVKYYLSLPENTKFKLDKTKDNFRVKVYKLIFDKLS